jgi:type IV pilus assembly protein PilA
MTFPAPPPDAPPPAAFPRPFGVVVLGLLNALGALLYLTGGGVLLAVGLASQPRDDGALVAAVVGGLIVLFGGLHAVTAIGLFTLRGFGRVCQMIQSGVGLLLVPLGTIVSALVLYYLTRPGMALLFSGRPPAAMTPGERALVARDSKQGVVIVLVLIVGLVLGIAVLGVVAAISIPALVRARMAANESLALGSMRAMSAAQAAFAATHGGHYGTLDCLSLQAVCPNADGSVPTEPFLSPTAALPGPRSGYTFRLLLSSDHARFVYWAEPEQRGTSGQRAFCVTDAAVVLAYPANEIFAPSDPDGGCPADGRTM